MPSTLMRTSGPRIAACLQQFAKQRRPNLNRTNASKHATKRWQCFTAIQCRAYAELKEKNTNKVAAGEGKIKQWAKKSE
eukprot:CAMPEP_0196652424 /NCGR_PEP_ID=MMETSP1086-20130531/1703_1 /TAXON_ID=77921 /ORGANISM="Cyanoptyche  gloeocystis , Strain SAG4.97" /LENGTH=78 /DNA_ID=CAMNT_0041982959 /DNA_START=406 /DNA_END=642 /DNA_ORIENTATION=+